MYFKQKKICIDINKKDKNKIKIKNIIFNLNIFDFKQFSKSFYFYVLIKSNYKFNKSSITGFLYHNLINKKIIKNKLKNFFFKFIFNYYKIILTHKLIDLYNYKII